MADEESLTFDGLRAVVDRMAPLDRDRCNRPAHPLDEACPLCQAYAASPPMFDETDGKVTETTSLYLRIFARGMKERALLLCGRHRDFVDTVRRYLQAAS